MKSERVSYSRKARMYLYLQQDLRYQRSLEAAKMLAADGIDAEVINIHTIKPIDRELIVKSVSKTGKAVTVEEHSINGGLGSAVAEVLCEEQPAKLLRIGVEDRFGESGPAVELIPQVWTGCRGHLQQSKELYEVVGLCASHLEAVFTGAAYSIFFRKI